MRRWWLLWLCALSAPAAALQLQTLAVSRDAGVFHVVVDVHLDATPQRVRAQLLNMQALPRLDTSVKAVRSMQRGDGLRVETELEQCLFGFCRRLLQVQQVRATGNQITAETLPEGSFRGGVAHWQWQAEGLGTRLLFTADTEPNLWLPPLIGPPAVLRQLRAKTEASLHRLEQLARE